MEYEEVHVYNVLITFDSFIVNKWVVLYTLKYIVNDTFPGNYRYSWETANPYIDEE